MGITPDLTARRIAMSMVVHPETSRVVQLLNKVSDRDRARLGLALADRGMEEVWAAHRVRDFETRFDKELWVASETVRRKVAFTTVAVVGGKQEFYI
jgi:hypothetical protein